MSFGFDDRACRVCGCTEARACVHPKHGPCWWVEHDLCSACAERPLLGVPLWVAATWALIFVGLVLAALWLGRHPPAAEALPLPAHVSVLKVHHA